MSESASGLAFRIRARGTPGSGGTNPPLPTAEGEATAHSAPPIPLAGMPEPLKKAEGVPAGMMPEPLTAQFQSKPPFAPKVPPPPPSAEQLAREQEERAKARLRLREAPAPTSAAPAVPTSNSAPPPPPYQQAPSPAGPTAMEKQVRPEDSRAFKWGVKLVFLVGLISVAGLAAIAWYFIQNRNPSPEGVPPMQAAKAVLAAVTPVQPTPVPTPSPAPVEVAKPLELMASQSALDEVVSRLGITGVATGSNPKAMINGAMYRPGQEIEGAEGVKLFSIDPATRTLTFVDSAGNRAKRKF